ncbi:MAG: DUF3291 domain-containing protein, partial [Gammaproteobacteria bacterium]
MNFHLVQVNIAIARYTCEDPRFAGFVDNLDRINALNTRSPSSRRSSAAARTNAGRFHVRQFLRSACTTRGRAWLTGLQTAKLKMLWPG